MPHATHHVHIYRRRRSEYIQKVKHLGPLGRFEAYSGKLSGRIWIFVWYATVWLEEVCLHVLLEIHMAIGGLACYGIVPLRPLPRLPISDLV